MKKNNQCKSKLDKNKKKYFKIKRKIKKKNSNLSSKGDDYFYK